MDLGHLSPHILQGCLTHLPRFKMATIFTDLIFKCIFVDEKFGIFIQISLKFVPEVPTNSESTLFQVMAWHLTGVKQLTEPMLTQLTDGCMWH